MSSNIYYPERKLLRKETAPQGLWDKLGRALGKEKAIEQPPFRSHIITIENVIKILDLPTIGLSVDKDKAPFHHFSFRSSSMECELPELGNVFVPMNIHMSDGVRDYFIVFIENELEVRYWPGYRLPLSDPEKLTTYAVTDTGILADIEKSFSALLDTTGVNKSFDEKYRDVKPTPFEKATLERFIKLIHPECEAWLMEDVFNAAQNPVGFYKANILRLQDQGYDEPFESLYLQLLLDGLDNADVLRTLDRKATRDDIENAISAISKGKYASMYTIRDGYDQDFSSFLRLAAGRMVNKGLKLVLIDNRSAAYNILLIKESDLDEMIQTGSKCGFKISVVM